MAEFRKINDTQVELHATPEEWDTIKTLLAYAADNYMALELEYNMSRREKQYFKDLRDFFTTNPPPNAIFPMGDAISLRHTISICCYDRKKIFSADQYLKIHNDLDKFDFHKEFNIHDPLAEVKQYLADSVKESI